MQKLATAAFTILGVICVSACSADFMSRFYANIKEQLASSDDQQTCGDGNTLAALVTDCPMAGVCFTSACQSHDLCYAFCEQPRRECDLDFYTDMTGICHESFAIDDPLLRQCTYFALAYYGAVDEYGGEVYPCDGAVPPAEVGACCASGSPPVCSESPMSQCGTPSVFLAGQSCADLEDLFGGCPAPENDNCEDAVEVCAVQTPSSEAGRCAGSTPSEIGDRACRLSSQDCLSGESCLPYEGAIFTCTVLGDNRLATTDGAIVGPECGFDLPNRFQADIWFRYTAPCTGAMSVSMCRGTQYDATLAVYAGGDACACADKADAVPLACDDDSCGGFQTGGLLSVPVDSEACYLIRVGGWSIDFSEAGASRGLSQLEIGVLCE